MDYGVMLGPLGRPFYGCGGGALFRGVPGEQG